MDNNPTSAPLLGKRYQLEQQLATGGMAMVYRARDLWLERPVAIKILRPDYSRDDAFRQRFHHEAKAAANLTHPNVVTVYDFGLDADSLYIVMEYVPGTDLKTMLKQRGILSTEETLNLMIQACAGVGYAHRSGLIHCDVKPQNMLVTPDHRLKVTDFGIARALSTIQPDEQHDVVWGSPLYFSPEQAAGNAPSPASDVYSLGVILYEMLTGRLPFVSSDPIELARMHRDMRPPAMHRLNPRIPQELEQIVTKVLSKEPSARYRTADQLGRVLQTYLQKGSTPLNPAPVRTNTPAPTVAPPPQPVYRPPAPARLQTDPYNLTQPEEEAHAGIDWLTTSLALIAILVVGGLIPFWLYIWFTLRAILP